MKLLRDCSRSYTLPQARAILAAGLQRELNALALKVLAVKVGAVFSGEDISSRSLAWIIAYTLMPGGNETRKRRAPARPKQRRLPGTE